VFIVSFTVLSFWNNYDCIGVNYMYVSYVYSVKKDEPIYDSSFRLFVLTIT